MRLLAACLIASLAFAAQAQSNGVYKWKDAKGVTHYSDTPPPSGRYGSVATAAPPAAAAPAPPARDARCAMARGNIAQLQGANADIGLDADGDGKPDAIMTDDQRKAKLRDELAAERTFCKAATP